MNPNFDSYGFHFETSVFVNCIVIVESLDGSKDLYTGRKLAEDLAFQCQQSQMALRLEKVGSRVEFFALLEKLELEAGKHGLKPVLHLEMHGSASDGLTLLNGDTVSWAEFARMTRRIVLAMDNNLVVVVGACYGIFAIAESRIFETTPFTMLIGSDRAVKQGEILSAFVPFYRNLVEEGSLAAATRSLPVGYSLFICERLLIQGYAKYYRNSVVGRGGDERVEYLVTELRRRHPARKLKELRRDVRARLRSGQDFEDVKRRFLLSDRPFNKERFVVGFAQLKAFVANAIRRGL